MPKYLALTKFTPEGLKGLHVSGAANRREAIRPMLESLGSSLEGYYFAFGEWDAYVIIDCPDDEAAAAASLAVNEAGAATATIVKLLTPEQVDVAFTRNASYRRPGE